MKFANPVASLALVSGFSSTNALFMPFRTSRKIVKTLDKFITETTMFEGVHLPKSLSKRDQFKDFFDVQLSSNLDQEIPLLKDLVPEFAEGLFDKYVPVVDYSPIIGTPKPKTPSEKRSKEYVALYTKVINRIIKVDADDTMPCEGYLYFGNQDYPKILSTLCQTCPFFASALTVSGDNDEYLELNGQGDSGSKYSAVMKTMIEINKSHHINVRFNRDMSVNQIVNYESGEAVVVPEEEWNYYASGVCFSMYYYAQCIHALIHVLHYLMTVGIVHSTKGNKSLNAWAEIYDDNIVLKYLEVASVLYDSSINLEARGGADGKKITGKDGLGGSVAVMDVMGEILRDWGSFKTEEEFTKKFLLKDLYDTAKDPEEVIKSAGILTEASKHFANIEPFATDLTAAMKADDAKAFEEAEENLTEFMSECGEGVSSIDSISSWVQLMSCTGIMHGSTLTFTRMTLMPEVMAWMYHDTDSWSKKETDFFDGTVPTMGGMSPGRHVFTHEVEDGSEWDTARISDGVKEVLQKYDDIANKLKVEYQDEIEKRDDFREFGWILTDHCPDGYDGKQHTLTTYI